MGLFDKLLGKKKKANLPPEITKVFDQVAKQSAMFDQMKKMMGIDFSKTKVDGVTNPNYGLVPENPVFVKGPVGTDFYLARLKTPSGENLKWNRVSSIETHNVSGATDIYDGYKADGTKYISIYVNWYGESNSDSAPEGLLLR